MNTADCPSPPMRTLAWVASFILLALIAVLSLAPHPLVNAWVYRLFAIAHLGTHEVRQGLIDATKVWHAVFYGLLTASLYPALCKRLGQAAGMASAVALVMELAQRLSATRTPHLVDLACSLAGVAAVSLAIRWIRR
jgi:hypothetical protein